VPSLLILLPLSFLIILNLPFRDILQRASFWVVAFFCLFQSIAVALHPFIFWSALPDPYGPFFSFRLSVDNLSLILLFSIGLVSFVSLVISRYTLLDNKQRFNFLNLLLIIVIGMNATVMVTDLFSLYVFLEVTSLSSFILISLKKDKLALEGAFKYIILSITATLAMLSAIALFLLISGDTSFVAIYGALGNPQHVFFSKLAIGLFICGLLVKSGIIPFHGWLPDAYSSSPNSVSVLLAGIVTKVSGVYVLMRMVVSVFGLNQALQDILMFLGCLSIVLGALAALGQTDFKRMLSYSSISQIGYIVLALGCGSSLAIAGAAFHILNHAIFKSLLFANATAVEEKTGNGSIEGLGGLAAKMPFTGITSLAAFLSTAGIPPFSGFWSKFIIVLALWQAGQYTYASIALLASVLTLAYFLILQRNVFFGKVASGLEGVREVRVGLIFPQVLLAVLTLGIGLFAPFFLSNFILAAGNILK